MTDTKTLREVFDGATPLTIDIRVGIVAIYPGPKQNCLEGIDREPGCFTARGTYVEAPGGGRWELPPLTVAVASLIGDGLRNLPALLDENDRLREALETAALGVNALCNYFEVPEGGGFAPTKHGLLLDRLRADLRRALGREVERER